MPVGNNEHHCYKPNIIHYTVTRDKIIYISIHELYEYLS